MQQEFKEHVASIRRDCGFDSPRVKFSKDLRSKVKGLERLEYFEGMTTLLECHPILAELRLDSDKLDFRKSLTYEILLRVLGHVRSIVANANVYNHIGTAVATRCLIEMCGFVSYLIETETLQNTAAVEKLLYGSVFTKGEWYEYETAWSKKNSGPLPEHFKEFLKNMLKTPHVSKYLKHVKEGDKGYDYLYSLYSQYVHPTFGPPRERFLEDTEYSKDFTDAINDSEYYRSLQQQQSPVVSVERDINLGAFCLEMIWPRIMDIDPLFDEKAGINLFKS